MQTDFEYIKFKQLQTPPGRKTGIWSCLNIHHGNCIGEVYWHGQWRQYCFFPAPQTVFSAGCLADIQTFIKELMRARHR